MLKPGGQAFITYVLTSPIITAKETLIKSEKWKLYLKYVQNYTSYSSENTCQNIKDLVEDVGFHYNFFIVEDREYTFLNYNNFESTLTLQKFNGLNLFLFRLLSFHKQI